MESFEFYFLVFFFFFFASSLLNKYHIVKMPSRAFEPKLCEESFQSFCVWASYHNFLSSKILGMSEQDAELFFSPLHLFTLLLPL